MYLWGGRDWRQGLLERGTALDNSVPTVRSLVPAHSVSKVSSFPGGRHSSACPSLPLSQSPTSLMAATKVLGLAHAHSLGALDVQAPSPGQRLILACCKVALGPMGNRGLLHRKRPSLGRTAQSSLNQEGSGQESAG